MPPIPPMQDATPFMLFIGEPMLPYPIGEDMHVPFMDPIPEPSMLLLNPLAAWGEHEFMETQAIEFIE